MMFRSAGCTRSGTARAGGEVTHPLQWSSEVHAPRRGEDSMGRGRINYLMVGVSISDGFTREGPPKKAYKPMKKARIFEEGANGIIKTAILHGSVGVLEKIMKVYDECTQGGVKLSEKESYVSIN